MEGMHDVFDDWDSLTVGGGGTKPKSLSGSPKPRYSQGDPSEVQQPSGAYSTPPREAREGFD